MKKRWLPLLFLTATFILVPFGHVLGYTQDECNQKIASDGGWCTQTSVCLKAIYAVPGIETITSIIPGIATQKNPTQVACTAYDYAYNSCPGNTYQSGALTQGGSPECLPSPANGVGTSDVGPPVAPNVETKPTATSIPAAPCTSSDPTDPNNPIGCTLNYQPLEPLPVALGQGGGDSSTLVGFLNYMFPILITLGAMTGVLFFTVYGIEYMLSSVVSTKVNALGHLKSVLYGMTLLIASVLILSTINPALLNLSAFDPNQQGTALNKLKQMLVSAGGGGTLTGGGSQIQSAPTAQSLFSAGQ